VTHVLQALGDPVRRSLIAQMAGGEQRVSALAERARGEFGIGISAVSQHLSVLRAAGLTRVRPQGRERFYRLDPVGFSALQAWLDHYRPFWSAAMDRLGEDLEEEG